MSHTRQEQMEAFGRFLDILDELRVKCPWDRKQTNESLRPNTIEETYELCDALMRDDKKDICKELGDVLLHVAFYAKIGSETGDFDIKDVCDKLHIRKYGAHGTSIRRSQGGNGRTGFRKLGTVETEGERRKQKRVKRSPCRPPFVNQGIPHSG